MNLDRYIDPRCDRRVKRDHHEVHYGIGQRVLRRVEAAYEPQRGEPTTRPLRIFASDPSLSCLAGRSVELHVPYEPLEPGPIGRLVEVDLSDRRTGDVYAPADLESRTVLIERGYAPSETDPRFHAQMVYAVVSTIHARFRRALGRQIGWSFGADDEQGEVPVPRRLRLVPFAGNDANAWYDAADGTLNFGYFAAELEPMGRTAPEARVFTSLANDIVAHETTHAMLDALRANFRVLSSNDMGGFHEGFADLVALFNRFLHKEVLRAAIVSSHGDLRQSTTLTEIGQQFQSAMNRGTALRSVVRNDPNFVYRDDMEPHAKGELLATAVYDAFVTVFERKVADDRRLATGGSGVFGAGALPDLFVDRLVARAETLAQQFLNVLIRAIDYLPPVDIRLGEYLRAIITADADLVHDDPWGYREAFIDAFRRRGIYPRGVASLSEDALLWRGPTAALEPIAELGFREIRFQGDPGLPVSVGEQIAQACALGEYMTRSQDHMHQFGLVPSGHDGLAGDSVGLPIIESIRTLRRPGSDGRVVFDTVAEILQLRRVASRDGFPGFDLWGGSTVIINSAGEVRLLVGKSVIGKERIERRLSFLSSSSGQQLWQIRNGRYVEKAGGNFRRLCVAPERPADKSERQEM